MDASEDYYLILGISRDANEDQIKKAYRKSALRWHPDKNLDNRELAERNFKRLAEAYEVLSDSQKRQVYDRYGKEGLVNGAADTGGPGPGFGFGFPGMADFLFGGAFGVPFGGGGGGPGMFFSFRDPNDVFREFFGGSDPFAEFFTDNNHNHHHYQQQQSNYGNNNYQQQQHSTMSFMDPFGMVGFGGMGGMGGMGGISGMSMQMSSSSSSGGGGPGGLNVKRISTSVKVVNGKRIETKRVVDNGVETVTVTENGQVMSRTVNGQPQLTN